MKKEKRKKLVKVYFKNQYGISQGNRMIGIVRANSYSQATKKAKLLTMYDYSNKAKIKAWKYFEWKWK